MNTDAMEGFDLPSAKELRKELQANKGRAKGTPTTCGVCGKQNSRNVAALNAVSKAHAECEARDLSKQAENIRKVLNLGDRLDFVKRGQYEKALEKAVALLKQAREEHDTYAEMAGNSTGENKSQRATMIKLLTEIGKLCKIELTQKGEDGEIVVNLAADLYSALKDKNSSEAQAA